VNRLDGALKGDNHPGGGGSSCWVMGLIQMILFALPICLVMTVNICLYSLAAFRMCLSPAADTLGDTDHSSISTFNNAFAPRRHKFKHQYIVSVQLTMLAGLTWMFAVVAAITKQRTIWCLFVLFDTLQAVFVCFAFICTRKVRKELDILV